MVLHPLKNVHQIRCRPSSALRMIVKASDYRSSDVIGEISIVKTAYVFAMLLEGDDPNGSTFVGEDILLDQRILHDPILELLCYRDE